MHVLPAGRILVPGRMPTAQQHIQQYSQGVHVGGYRDGSAQYLFGRRVIGGENPEALVREIRLRIRFHLVFDQFGDAEVEQLYNPIFGHMDIRRLDVSMYDQVRVCMPDRGQHVQKQLQSCLDSQTAFIAMAIDGAALYILQHEIWLAGVRHTRVHYARDVRVRESGQYATLTPEAFFTVAANERCIQQFDSDIALK